MQKPSDPAAATVYYNSACPVCAAGIRHERDRLQGCDVQWVDVHSRPEAAAAAGVPLEEVRKRLRVAKAGGEVFVGAAAMAELWSRRPGTRWRARVLRWPVIRWLAALLYDGFAGVLYRWNRSRGHW